jgi:dipeptidase E
MKLYLSSYRLGNNTKELVKMVGKNKKAAIITNALDFSTDPVRKNSSIAREINDLENLGFQPEELDLRIYFNKPAKLSKDLSSYGLIWVIGGNSFILRKAMKLSCMDKWLIKQKGNPDVVYAGYSAGVCVLAPSLRGLEIVDDPKAKAKGYDNKTIWDGVGIVNWTFAPHYRSDHPESAKVNKEVEYYIDNKILFKALRDGEVIIEI